MTEYCGNCHKEMQASKAGGIIHHKFKTSIDSKFYETSWLCMACSNASTPGTMQIMRYQRNTKDFGKHPFLEEQQRARLAMQLEISKAKKEMELRLVKKRVEGETEKEKQYWVKINSMRDDWSKDENLRKKHPNFFAYFEEKKPAFKPKPLLAR